MGCRVQGIQVYGKWQAAFRKDRDAHGGSPLLEPSTQGDRARLAMKREVAARSESLAGYFVRTKGSFLGEVAVVEVFEDEQMRVLRGDLAPQSEAIRRLTADAKPS